MKKILPYIVIAILLGTVTMVVPLALLEPSYYTSLTEDSTLIQPSSTEPPTEDPKLDNQDRADIEGGTFESVPSEPLEPEEPPAEVPAPAPEYSEQSETEKPREEALEPTFGGTDLTLESLSNLSPIGLLTIPSFLIALGAFIYLRKRMS